MEHPPTLFDALQGLLPLGVSTLVAALGVVLLVSFFVGRGVSANPDAAVVPAPSFTLRNFLELLLEGVVSLAQEMMGHRWKTYLPLCATLGLFILVSNLMGLVPYMSGPTSFIETNAAWALIAFLVSEAVGFKEHGLGYFKHFAPGPLWIAPLLFPLEILSHFVRVVSLTIRLTANMFADHTLYAVMLSLPVVSFFVPSAVLGLGVFVAFVQALIFTALTMSYIGQALEEAH